MDMNHPAIQAGNAALGAFFAECEKYAWLGAATNVVHLDMIDAKLVPIAEGTGMQLTVIKVSLDVAFKMHCAFYFKYLYGGVVHFGIVFGVPRVVLAAQDPWYQSQAFCIHDGWFVSHAMDIWSRLDSFFYHFCHHLLVVFDRAKEACS